MKTVVPTDPCSDALNPKCEPIKCALTTPAGAYVDALCALDPATKTCTCGGGLIPEDPCSDALNPKCEPKDCKLATGAVGTCKFNANKVCGCEPAVPDGWCAPCKSAADCPAGTTCADDDNDSATQTVCTMIYTPAVGCPTGLHGDYTVSKYCICP